MSYREGALVCPGCGALLDAHQVQDAVIDVCPACGGVWVDWFDGELSAMVRGAPPHGAALPAGAGTSACPRCRSPLQEERYLDGPARILRCGDCAGAFVARDAARAVAAGGRAGEAPEGAIERLAAVLRRWFGWDAGPP